MFQDLLSNRIIEPQNNWFSRYFGAAGLNLSFAPLKPASFFVR
jgi:hypothetical protein